MCTVGNYIYISLLLFYFLSFWTHLWRLESRKKKCAFRIDLNELPIPCVFGIFYIDHMHIIIYRNGDESYLIFNTSVAVNKQRSKTNSWFDMYWGQWLENKLSQRQNDISLKYFYFQIEGSQFACIKVELFAYKI